MTIQTGSAPMGRHFDPEDVGVPATSMRRGVDRRMPAADGRAARDGFVTDRMLTGTGRFAAGSGAE
jgi:hypothetical protein